MGLTTSPPRLPLIQATPASHWFSPLILPLLMALSLLGTAALSGPLFARIPSVPRITPELLVQLAGHPDDIRLKVRLYLGPGTQHATYAFVQMNPESTIDPSTWALETATCTDGKERHRITDGTQAQVALLQRMLAVPGRAWHPLELHPIRVNPQRRVRVTIFAPDGEVLAAGELSSFDRDAGARGFMEHLVDRRSDLLLERPLRTLESGTSTQEPADS